MVFLGAVGTTSCRLFTMTEATDTVPRCVVTAAHPTHHLLLTLPLVMPKPLTLEAADGFWDKGPAAEASPAAKVQ